MTTDSSPMSSGRPLLKTWLYFGLAVLCLLGFYDNGQGYQNYRIVYGQGHVHIHTFELVFYLWYVTCGGLAALFFTAALAQTSLPQRLVQGVRRLLLHRTWLLLASGVLVLSLGLFWWLALFAGQRIVDDESTYLFIAQTLELGRVINPLPQDPTFYKNQFVVFNSSGWFGKYPIGFPTLLAFGRLLGSEAIVNPLLTLGSMWLTYWIGVRVFSKNVAGLAVLFLLVSPHFVWTGTTLLSQPASTFCMLVGFYAMLRVYESPHGSWALLGGVAWGFAVMVRPFPGALFLLVACGHYLYVQHQRGWRGQLWTRLKPLLFAGVPVAACAVLLLWVNRIQAGSALSSGYHQAHKVLTFFVTDQGAMSSSLFGALLRENFWLLGWPLSFLFVGFAFQGNHLGLLWGLVGADYAYRIIVPKTVVATTGPVYVTEAVPLLCLASAAGLVFLYKKSQELDWVQAQKWLVSLPLSMTLVACFTFYPVHLQAVQESCEIWNTPYRMLREAKAKKKVLVFANYMIPSTFDNSWAYHPPNPSPTLQDDVIFVRIPRGANSRTKMRTFWKKNHAHRQAWLFFYSRRRPHLMKMWEPLSKP